LIPGTVDLICGTADLRRSTDRIVTRYGGFVFEYGFAEHRTWNQADTACGPYLESSAPEMNAGVDATIIMMRTTLNLPEDISHVVRAVAQARGLSLGDAVAELIRQGLRPDARMAEDGEVPHFEVPADAPPITLEQTLAAEDER
jgi:hypothetical protein